MISDPLLRAISRTPWTKKNGKKWNRASRIRVARHFRAYVRTPSKPKAPIIREPCHFHPYVLGEAHHIDYRRPFVVVWLCGWAGMSCHRRVERGLLEVPPEAVRDYTEVVKPFLRPGARGKKNGMSKHRRKISSMEARAAVDKAMKTFEAKAKEILNRRHKLPF